MKKNNFGYLIREGVRGVFLHGFMSFAAVCVTVACLIIMGSFSLILYNLNLMVKEAEQENEILVYIDETYSEAEAKSVGSQINMISNVYNAQFVSREQALSNFVDEQEMSPLFPELTGGVNSHQQIGSAEISATEKMNCRRLFVGLLHHIDHSPCFACQRGSGDDRKCAQRAVVKALGKFLVDISAYIRHPVAAAVKFLARREHPSVIEL